MTDLPENELFSAYLDGELTAEEQAQVEQLLATSAAARQLMDELRTLSSTLQSLPIRKPRVDLSQRVLRAAERQILSGGDVRTPSGGDSRLPSGHDVRPADAGQVPEPAAPPASIVGRDLWKRFLRPRSLLWAAAIFLVALFLRLQEAGRPNLPDAGPHRGEQIAMEQARDRARGPSSIHAPEKSDLRRESPQPAEVASKPAEMTSQTAEIAPGPAGKTGATVGFPNRDLRTAGQAGSDAIERLAKPLANAHATRVEEPAPGSSFGSGQPAAPRDEPTTEAAAPAEVAAAAPPRSKQGKSPADAVVLRDKGGESQPGQVALERGPKKPFAPPAAPVPGLGPNREKPGAIAGRSNHPAKGAFRALESKPAAKVLLVECEVTSQAAHDHVFEKMLADQRLSDRPAEYRRRGAAAGPDAAEDKPVAGKAGVARDELNLAKAAKKGADRDAENEAKVDSLAQSGPASPVEKEKRAEVAETRSFDVEATPQQLGAILQRLEARRGDFLSVTSAPEVNELRDQVDQIAADGVKQRESDKGRFGGAGAGGLGGAFQQQGVTANAVPAPASPQSTAEQKAAAGRPMEESQVQNMAEARKSFASPKDQAAGSQQQPQAKQSKDFTWVLRPATVPGAKPLPACLTYRVRFVLKVVPPQSSAGEAVANHVSQPAKPAESKPAAPPPTAAPAAPAAVQPTPASPSK
jgi:hypothetical protein